ncbi:hypothetical protein [Salinispora arenicola]|uniref:hypothetical protein n=1 Tax=Salinispora arenicola TaxID=168697 RepID=UPI0016B1772C|nr:hypothetical protein [Salinispora arenicola]NIL57091.1 hypothetical protein [Salinispora arenicola]NIL62688.1 hypothetical protein [Salinispora arenicola]
METLLYGAAAIVAIGAAAQVLHKVVLGARRASRLVDDLLGEPPRPGLLDGRPGLMARVVRIEGRLDALEELRPNGGSSIKDQVDRIAHATGADKPER